MSGSTPASKVMVMAMRPAESLVDDMYAMPSIPFICCSITWVTVSCTVWADAPGYEVVIRICGGAMSGYWATGRLSIDNPPASIVTSAITHAKIGRSIKNRAISGLLLRGHVDNAHRHTGLHFLHPFNNDAVTHLKAVFNQPLVANRARYP